jgi:Flp pilus assembly protein TadG
MRKLRGKKARLGGSAVSSQRGIVVPIVAIGLLAILAVAGLALDGSHALGNKTRMQNTVDAAALAAAKELDLPDGTTTKATAAANSLFSINADGAGNHELNEAYDGGEITVTVQYSATVNPFTPGSPDGPFVRVIATGFDTQTTLSRVLGINEIPTPATAVAGPSGPLGSGPGARICDVAPIAVCPPKDPAGNPLPFDTDDFHVLKPTGGNHDDIGPGNYKMLRLGCSGGACLRENLAGDFDDCVTHSDQVDTEPGISAGPTSQGFNTRFNEYQGAGLNSTDYPPDLVITGQSQELRACWDDITDPLNPVDRIYQPNGQANNYCQGYDPTEDPWTTDEVFDAITNDDTVYTHNDYVIDNSPGNEGAWIEGGLPDRRVLIFPMVNCDGSQTGQSLLDVTGFACFFMLQPLDTGNIGQGGGQIFGQYIGECNANGSGSITPTPGPGPLLYKIQLYKDPDSGDS